MTNTAPKGKSVVPIGGYKPGDEVRFTGAFAPNGYKPGMVAAVAGLDYRRRLVGLRWWEYIYTPFWCSADELAPVGDPPGGPLGWVELRANGDRVLETERAGDFAALGALIVRAGEHGLELGDIAWATLTSAEGERLGSRTVYADPADPAEPRLAVADWSRKARVRVLVDIPARDTLFKVNAYNAGAEVELVQWGRAGRTVDTGPGDRAWFSSFDIDGAVILSDRQVEVIEVLSEATPYARNYRAEARNAAMQREQRYWSWLMAQHYRNGGVDG